MDLIAPERAEIPGGAKIPKHSPGNVTPTTIKVHRGIVISALDMAVNFRAFGARIPQHSTCNVTSASIKVYWSMIISAPDRAKIFRTFSGEILNNRQAL